MLKPQQAWNNLFKVLILFILGLLLLHGVEKAKAAEGTAYLTDQYVKGEYRICIYNWRGQQVRFYIPTTSICNTMVTMEKEYTYDSL